MLRVKAEKQVPGKQRGPRQDIHRAGYSHRAHHVQLVSAGSACPVQSISGTDLRYDLGRGLSGPPPTGSISMVRAVPQAVLASFRAGVGCNPAPVCPQAR